MPTDTLRGAPGAKKVEPRSGYSPSAFAGKGRALKLPLASKPLLPSWAAVA